MSEPIRGAVVAHGVVGATAVVSNCDAAGLATMRYVTLSANYARTIPAGDPDPNAGANPKTSPTATPQTLLSGKRVLLFAHEAAALVAAGGGVYS